MWQADSSGIESMGEPLLEMVIRDIEENWDRVVSPQADPGRWSEALAVEFYGYTVWNWTEFNYDRCHAYEIVMHPGAYVRPGSRDAWRILAQQLGGRLYSLNLMLSAVAPYYIVKVICVEEDGQPRTVEAVSPIHQQLLDRAERFAQSRGFQKLPGQYFEHMLPDVELEIAPRGQVTVFNCLFTDSDLPLSQVW
jgi:hypothetical protein